MTTSNSPALWSRAAADDLARGLLSPLTWSVLSHSAERAVRAHYRAWGITLPADARIWRRIEGRAYLNTSALTAADQAVAAGEAETASGGWRLFGRKPENRHAELLRAQLEGAPAVFAATARWWEQVATLTWRQATVLQVMEEIEPQAEAVLAVRDYLTTGLGSKRRQLTRWVAEWQPDAPHALFDDLFAGLDGREGWAQYRYDLQSLLQAARQNATAATWLRSGEGNAPAGAFADALAGFLAAYGRWADQPLEVASPRWAEEPAALYSRLAARLTEPPDPALLSPQVAHTRRAAAAQALTARLDAKQQRQFTPVFEQLQQIVDLLPASRAALVTVIAAARQWSFGAAQEGVADGRLLAADDVFLLELEELKQLMTGELYDAAQVQALVARRRAEQARWAGQEPPEIVQD